MRDQDKEQSKDKQSAATLKEVYQTAANKSADAIGSDQDQPSSAEAVEQIKGSDADVDPNVGFDKQICTEEGAEQVKGSDADTSQES